LPPHGCKARSKPGFTFTLEGLYTKIPTFVGFVPKSFNRVRVPAGMLAAGGPAVPVGVLDEVVGVNVGVTGVLVVGAAVDVLLPGRHWEYQSLIFVQT
jgi:hypothetical protein